MERITALCFNSKALNSSEYKAGLWFETILFVLSTISTFYLQGVYLTRALHDACLRIKSKKALFLM